MQIKPRKSASECPDLVVINEVAGMPVRGFNAIFVASKVQILQTEYVCTHVYFAIYRYCEGKVRLVAFCCHMKTALFTFVYCSFLGLEFWYKFQSFPFD